MIRPDIQPAFGDHAKVSQELDGLLEPGTTVFPLTIPLIGVRPAFGLLEEADGKMPGVVAATITNDEAQTISFRLATYDEDALFGLPITSEGALGIPEGVEVKAIFKALVAVLKNNETTEISGILQNGQSITIPKAHEDTGRKFSGNSYFGNALSDILIKRCIGKKEGEYLDLAGNRSILKRAS